MSTALVIGNGNILVNINDRLQVTDFYFPHIGQENHLAKYINRLFFRINGQIVDCDHDCFDIQTSYINDSLVGNSKLIHKDTGIEFQFYDFVIPNQDIFVRKFEIYNPNNYTSEISVYFQNNFSMYENDIGDTAVWYQPASALVHYKKNRYIGITSSQKIYQFSCAARSDNGGKGAYPDWQSGELYFNPISNGSVNSCVSFKFQIDPQKKIQSDCIFLTGKNFEDIEKSVSDLGSHDMDYVLNSTAIYWQNWVHSKTSTLYENSISPKFFGDKNLDKKIFELYKRSLLTIRTQIDNCGAVVAANDGKYLKEGGKDTYSYFWPRDGAYTIKSLIECGFKELSDNYFEYLEKLITPEGYFLHKYFTGGKNGNSLGSSWHPWIDKSGHFQLPIQEDETALNLWLIYEHFKKFSDQEFLNKYWETLIFPMANFLGNYRYTIQYESETMEEKVVGYQGLSNENEFDENFANSKLPRPSYDLWEERRGIASYTVSTVYAGLKSAVELSKVFGRNDLANIFDGYAEEMKESFLKTMYKENLGRFLTRINCNLYTNSCEFDQSVDASLYGIWHFGLLDINDPRVESTMKAIEEKLTVKTDIGGIARRENDHYHSIDKNLTGNPWFICTLWLAQYWIKKNNLEKAKGYIEWAISHTDYSGLMAEQAHPYTGHGESVKPLTWSHSEFVRTVNMLTQDHL